MRKLLVLAAIGLGTYAMRAVFLVTARTEPPAVVARLLPYVGPAVLAAIILPVLLAPAARSRWPRACPHSVPRPCPGCSGGAPSGCLSHSSAGSADGGSRAPCSRPSDGSATGTTRVDGTM